jgi:hypothetical protein
MKIKEEMCAQLLIHMFLDLGVWKRLIGDGMGVRMYEWGTVGVIVHHWMCLGGCGCHHWMHQDGGGERGCFGDG